MRLPRTLLLTARSARRDSRSSPPPRPAFPAPSPAPARAAISWSSSTTPATGFTTFLNLRSTGASALPVQILLYGPDLGAPFVYPVTLPVGPGEAGEAGVGGTLTIDIGGLARAACPRRPASPSSPPSTRPARRS